MLENNNFEKNKIDELLLIATSYQNPFIPEVKGIVRAELVIGGWLVTPKPNNEGCHVIYIIQTDLKGSIPTRVVNSVSQQQPLLIASIKNFINDNNISQQVNTCGTNPLTNEAFEIVFF